MTLLAGSANVAPMRVGMAERALGAWDVGPATVAALGRGLINDTFAVTAADRSLVLQRLNPIFDPVIHHNIAAVTGRLADVGMPTPRLLPTRVGTRWHRDETGEVWRLMTYVPGATFDVVASEAQAFSGGELVGRFHRALVGLRHAFVGQRIGVHDLGKHLGALTAALAAHGAHRLWVEVAALARDIQAAAATLPPLPVLAAIVGHGDLKLNNLRFAGPEPPARDVAVCLVDLDTLGLVQLGHELGDLWRSWCNRGGEDAAGAALDLGIFAASWQGYQRGQGRAFASVERQALLVGPEHVSLGLAARFAADALVERYFGWDRTRHPGAGEHNLARARSQLALYRSLVVSRVARATLLGLDDRAGVEPSAPRVTR